MPPTHEPANRRVLAESWRGTAWFPYSMSSGQIEPGRLQLGVLLERVQRLVAADSRLLESTEWHGDVVRVITVDENSSGPQRFGRAMGDGDVARPYGSYEPVDHIISNLDRLVDSLERDRGQHRPKNLLTRNRHARPNAIKHRRLDKVAAAVLANPAATEEHVCAVLATGINEAHHPLQLD